MSKTQEFQFEGQWKELLLVTCSRGGFLLDFPMGTTPTVNLPGKAKWQGMAPEWAKEDWVQLHSELAAWCNLHDIALGVDIWEGASVYPL